MAMGLTKRKGVVTGRGYCQPHSPLVGMMTVLMLGCGHVVMRTGRPRLRKGALIICPTCYAIDLDNFKRETADLP